MNPNDPSPPIPPRKPVIGGFAGLDPGDLIARGFNTVQPSPGAQPWEPPTPAELAALLPQYGITALLGHGGMGAVYRGVQPALDRPVAIKLLPAEMAADTQFIARFQREARTLAKLQHPGIVAVHDFGQTSAGHLYFVMEFVEGTDLQRILHGPGLNPEQALALISQICDALHYAHGQGVIHRDIKPANILVTKDGRAKVADFGLARPLREDISTLSSANAIVGTDAYMAPEQRTGHADQRADIYALGVMLYEMLTGQRPQGVFDPPSRKVQIDIRLDEVVLKALQEKPARRYQHASEMKTDVDRIRSTPPENAERGRRKAERKASRGRAVAFIAGCLVVAGAVGCFLWKNARKHREPDRVAKTLKSSAALQREGAVDGLKPSTTLPAAATKETPFMNTLGMKFVPVPITGGPTDGQRVLFSVWETRVQDYEVFVKQTNRERRKPRFEQGSTHPAVMVNWEDATAFCAWLTERERNAGTLSAHEAYRLPSDHEWSCAIGIGDREDPAELPSKKNGTNADTFPWGNSWPPPPALDNYSGEEGTDFVEPSRIVIKGFRDDFVFTAPVGSFAASPSGLFDLGGNVRELCDDWFDAARNGRTVRGSAFPFGKRADVLSSCRNRCPPIHFYDALGFRVVLAPATFAPTATAVPPATLGPKRIGTDSDWKAIAVGEHHALAIKTDGSLWAWGENAFGQLGIGERENRQGPVRIGSDNDWVAIAGSSEHSVALKSDGSLWTWGRNQHGQLGDGTTQEHTKPERVGTAGNWKTIFAATSHILALKSDGSLWGWGNNYYSQLGDATRNPRLHPAQTGLDRDWIAVRTGHSNSIALKSEGSLWVWGSNEWSHPGGKDYEIVPRPSHIALDRPWIAIGARAGRIYAIGKDGTLWGCGSNSYGQVGIGRKSPRANWTQIGTATDWKLVAAAVDETFALKTNGSLWAWGRNHNGQLGDGTTIDRPSPVRLGTDTDWDTIAASQHGALGLKQDGSLWAWGLDF